MAHAGESLSVTVVQGGQPACWRKRPWHAVPCHVGWLGSPFPTMHAKSAFTPRTSGINALG